MEPNQNGHITLNDSVARQPIEDANCTMSTSEAAEIAADQPSTDQAATSLTPDQIAAFIQDGVKNGIKRGIRRRKTNKDEINRAKHAELKLSKRRMANKAAKQSRKKNR